jgi:hypothetical protein
MVHAEVEARAGEKCEGGGDRSLGPSARAAGRHERIGNPDEDGGQHGDRRDGNE